MFAFLLTALATIAVIWFGRPLAAAFARLGEPRTRRRERALGGPLGLAVRATVVLALVAAVAAGLWNWEFFASSRNFRIVAGAVFGALVWLFARQLVLAGPASDQARAAHYAGAGEGLAAGGPTAGGRGLWNPAVFLAVGLVVIWIWALVAPHGELDLAGVRAVKTPFIEAQFARNESDLRLDLELEREAEGFLTLGPAGLEHALFMPRAQVVYDRARTRMEGEAPPGARRSGDAFYLVAEVLQPVARCVHALKRRYGDRATIDGLLAPVASGWSRAILNARTAVDADDAAALQRLEEALLGALGRFERAVDELLWPPTSPLGGPAEALCRRRFADPLAPRARPLSFGRPTVTAVGAVEPGSWAAVVLDPAVVHATAVFHLWRGDPAAALRLVDGAVGGDTDASLDYVRGFARRWQQREIGAPEVYLVPWARGIRTSEDRARTLRRWAAAMDPSCPASGHEPTTIAYGRLVSAPLVRELSACELQTTAGYYAFRAQKLRMHLVYESARLLLTGRRFPERARTMARARAHARHLLRFVDADELRAEDAFMLQMASLDGGARSVPLASASALHDYAFALDAVGAARLAAAFDDGDAEPEETEAAIVLFERALAYAAEANVGWRFDEEVRDRLEQARRAIALSAS